MAFGRTNATSAAIGAWRFMHAAALPETALHNTFLAITAIEPMTVLLSDAVPTEPAAGDLWFQIDDPTDGMAMSNTALPFKVMGAYQYDATNGTWTLLPAYYTYLRAWRELPGLPPEGTPLGSCSWDQIHRIGKAGKAAEYFCVGDTKDIALATGEILTLRIIGFDHDDLTAAGGGKAPITFDTADCMNTAQPMNASNTNVGGYSGSALYAALTNTIYGTLPQDLRTVMKEVNKFTTAGSNSATVVTTAEKLFLLSEVETTGQVVKGFSGEGVQYAFYTSGGTRVKRVNDAASGWWLRTPCKAITNGIAGTTHFAGNTNSGAIAHLGASTASGVAFGLCV